MSSEDIFLRIVVFPALSKPKSNILTSLSGADLNFLKIDRRPFKLANDFLKRLKLSDRNFLKTNTLTIQTKLKGYSVTFTLNEVLEKYLKL